MTYLEFIEEWRSDSEFCRVHTSGSTGDPKDLLLPKSMMRASAKRTVDFFNLGIHSRLHSCISPDFIGGKMIAVRAEICGGTFSFEVPSNRPKLRGESESWPDLVAVVPSQMLHILDYAYLLPKNNIIFLVGGSALPESLRNKIEVAGLRAWESYGMTETASHIALRRIKRNPEPFLPLPGIKIGKDSRNCLTIELPVSDEHDSPYQQIVTNDCVRLTENGGFELLGRADNVIVSGGMKIHPEDVESRLLPALEQFGIQAILIEGIPDPKWGEKVIIRIERNSSLSITDNELVAYVQNEARRVLHTFEIPKEYYLENHLPRTLNGKLHRH